MRLTEFWSRMEDHLGAAYATSFAHDHVITELHGLTVDQALEAGFRDSDETCGGALFDGFVRALFRDDADLP